MDTWNPIHTALAVLFCMFILSMVIFFLHRSAIHTFQNELSIERKQNLEIWKSYMDLKIRQHEQVISLLVGPEEAKKLKDVLSLPRIKEGGS